MQHNNCGERIQCFMQIIARTHAAPLNSEWYTLACYVLYIWHISGMIHARREYCHPGLVAAPHLIDI